MLGLLACDHDTALARIERELQSAAGDAGPAAMAGSSGAGGAAGESVASGGTAATSPEQPMEPQSPPDVPRDPLTLEPNDTFEMAAPVEFDETYDYLSLSADNDEIDLYRIGVEAGATYTLVLQNASSCYLGFQVDLGADGQRSELLEWHSTVVNQTGGFQENVRSHVVEEFSSPETGVALVRIDSSGLGAGCGRYALTVYRSTSAGLEHDVVTLEPNDSPSMAAPVAVGVARESMSLTAYVDTTDYFQFGPAVGGDDYTLIIDNPRRCALDYGLSVVRGGMPLQMIGPATTFRLDDDLERVEATASAAADGTLLLEVSTYVVSGSCNGYEVLLQHLARSTP